MSKEYRNSSATYNVPLDVNENDVFLIGCAHLYHFLHINSKTVDCKAPMMLKMHLEIDHHLAPSIGEAEEQRNIVENNFNPGLRKTLEQLEEQIKSLREALQQAMEDVVNRCDKAKANPPADGSNSNKKEKKFNRKKKLSGGEHNAKGHQLNSMPKEKQNVIDLTRNCVYIQNVQCIDSSLEKAFDNVRILANGMNAKIPANSVIHIDVERRDGIYLDYYVHFRNADSKRKFLKNRNLYGYHPETSRMRIFDHNEWGIVDIKNVRSSDMSLKAAYENVIGLADKMGIADDWNLRDSIDFIDVFSLKPNILTYSVRFNDNFHKNEFVKRRHRLKEFPETKSLEILDGDGHRLRLRNINNVSMSLASANVIGMAKVMGLPSLCPDYLKRIYALNYVPYSCDASGLSFAVEFSSKGLKDEFLKRKLKLHGMGYFYNEIEILDIHEEKNIAVIKYETGHLVTAFSFIGLAKQLGVWLTPDQIQNFFDLSEFTHEA